MKVTRVCDHYPEGQAQREEDLSVGRKPDFGIEELAEIRLQIKLQSLHRPVKRYTPDDEQQDENRR